MDKYRKRTVLSRSRFLVVGIIGLCLVGYAVFSGPMGSAPIPEGASAVVQQAKADLALRKGIGEAQIAVASVEAVTWPDTSLGCPKPGMFYAQVITPGYRIVLSHAGEIYEYHSDRSDRLVYCSGS